MCSTMSTCSASETSLNVPGSTYLHVHACMREEAMISVTSPHAAMHEEIVKRQYM